MSGGLLVDDFARELLALSRGGGRGASTEWVVLWFRHDAPVRSANCMSAWGPWHWPALHRLFRKHRATHWGVAKTREFLLQ